MLQMHRAFATTRRPAHGKTTNLPPTPETVADALLRIYDTPSSDPFRVPLQRAAATTAALILESPSDPRSTLAAQTTEIATAHISLARSLPQHPPAQLPLRQLLTSALPGVREPQLRASADATACSLSDAAQAFAVPLFSCNRPGFIVTSTRPQPVSRAAVPLISLACSTGPPESGTTLHSLERSLPRGRTDKGSLTRSALDDRIGVMSD